VYGCEVAAAPSSQGLLSVPIIAPTSIPTPYLFSKITHASSVALTPFSPNNQYNTIKTAEA
jgi:hypothetical protein